MITTKLTQTIFCVSRYIVASGGSSLGGEGVRYGSSNGIDWNSVQPPGGPALCFCKQADTVDISACKKKAFPSRLVRYIGLDCASRVGIGGGERLSSVNGFWGGFSRVLVYTLWVPE